MFFYVTKEDLEYPASRLFFFNIFTVILKFCAIPFLVLVSPGQIIWGGIKGLRSMHQYFHVFMGMLYWRWQWHRNALLVTLLFLFHCNSSCAYHSL